MEFVVGKSWNHVQQAKDVMYETQLKVFGWNQERSALEVQMMKILVQMGGTE